MTSVQHTAGGVDDASRLLSTLQVDLDPGLLALALTHRSYSYEHGGIPTNERLEFLGDSILGQAVTVMLYTSYPDLDEGELAKRRASLVSTVALAEIGRTIGLGEHLKLGKGEELTGGRDKSSILADAMEAIIGATYLDLGPDVATALVLRLVDPLVRDPRRFGVSMDPKTALQEAAAERGYGVPVYVIESAGPDHQKTFTATVTLTPARADAGAPVIESGGGTSKKQAEMSAASAAFDAVTAY